MQGAWCFAHQTNSRNIGFAVRVSGGGVLPLNFISPLVHLVEVAPRAEFVGRILRPFIGEAENLRLAHRRRNGAVVPAVKSGFVQL